MQSQNTFVYDFDIAIVGGGIVGATLAAALKDSGLSIALIEAQSESKAIAKGQAYAVHLSSKRIWQDIGLWDVIEPQVEPFNQVHLSDSDYPHIVKFRPQDLKQTVLGYVAKHKILLKELLTFLHQHCPNVTIYRPYAVKQIEVQTSLVSIGLAPVPQSETASPFIPSKTLTTRLIVGADGSRSQVRQAAKIKTTGWTYGQSCLVATIAPEFHHQNIAYEKFWPSGPFAILPSGNRQCRIVWTAPHQEAEALLRLSDEEFVQRLRHRYGTQMGQLQVVSPRYIFPAQLKHAKNYVRHRVALVGDAAHSCHPVGGQGLNLGIRDAAALAMVLTRAYQQGKDVGNLSVLRPYQRWRKRQNFASLRFTDLLNRLFSNEIPIIRTTRRMSLRLMQVMPWIRVTALKFMAGLLAF